MSELPEIQNIWSVQGASLVTIWTGMFGSREAGLGRVWSFNRWASVKEGIRRASNPWFEADWIFIDTSVVKERGNFLINGFPRVARPDLYFEEYWSMELRWKKDWEGLLTHSLKLNFLSLLSVWVLIKVLQIPFHVQRVFRDMRFSLEILKRWGYVC